MPASRRVRGGIFDLSEQRFDIVRAVAAHAVDEEEIIEELQLRGVPFLIAAVPLLRRRGGWRNAFIISASRYSGYCFLAASSFASFTAAAFSMSTSRMLLM